MTSVFHISKKDETSKRIQAAMENRDISYRVLSDLIEMPYFKLRHFILNPDNKSLLILKALAKALEVSETWLLSGKGEPEDGLDFIYRYYLSNTSLCESRSYRSNADDDIEIIVDKKSIFPCGSILVLQQKPHSFAVFEQDKKGVIGNITDKDNVHFTDSVSIDMSFNRIGFISRVIFP